MLRDKSVLVWGGLLVRQNYTETDIGEDKAEALAARLRAISDRTEVRAICSPLPGNLAEIAAAADVIIDATVSTAVGQILAALAADENQYALLAQVATDTAAGHSTSSRCQRQATPTGPP